MDHGDVIRFNYRQAAYARLFGNGSVVVMTERLRFAILLIGAALITVTATSSFEAHRAAMLRSELAALHTRERLAAADEARAERLIAAVIRLRVIHDRVVRARRDVLLGTNVVARIGNDLPPQTWLTAIGSTPAGTWTIGGRSTRVEEIGTMLHRIEGIDPGATTRLVSIAATGRSGRILDFVLGWDRRP